VWGGIHPSRARFLTTPTTQQHEARLRTPDLVPKKSEETGAGSSLVWGGIHPSRCILTESCDNRNDYKDHNDPVFSGEAQPDARNMAVKEQNLLGCWRARRARPGAARPSARLWPERSPPWAPQPPGLAAGCARPAGGNVHAYMCEKMG